MGKLASSPPTNHSATKQGGPLDIASAEPTPAIMHKATRETFHWKSKHAPETLELQTKVTTRSRVSIPSSWEMSARSLFARQRVESLRWLATGESTRNWATPSELRFGCHRPQRNFIARSWQRSGMAMARFETPPWSRAPGELVGCSQQQQGWSVLATHRALQSQRRLYYTFSPARLAAKLCSVLHCYSLMNEGWRS